MSKFKNTRGLVHNWITQVNPEWAPHSTDPELQYNDLIPVQLRESSSSQDSVKSVFMS